MTAIHTTDSSFKADVLESTVPVLVDFWASWCGPCKMLSPIIDELSKELGTKVKIVKVDVDENPTVASAYDVRTIPTMIVFKKGEVVDTKIGVLPKQRLQEWIETVTR